MFPSCLYSVRLRSTPWPLPVLQAISRALPRVRLPPSRLSHCHLETSVIYAKAYQRWGHASIVTGGSAVVALTVITSAGTAPIAPTMPRVAVMLPQISSGALPSHTRWTRALPRVPQMLPWALPRVALMLQQMRRFLNPAPGAAAGAARSATFRRRRRLRRPAARPL